MQVPTCGEYKTWGTIMMPVEHSGASKADIEIVIAEARKTGSNVLVLGIVPMHLYSAGEKEEVESITKRTVAAIKRIKKALTEKGIEAIEIIRSGFPDEEIQKAAEEFKVSLIMLPAEGSTPSELAKAATILLEDPNSIGMPVCLIPAFSLS